MKLVADENVDGPVVQHLRHAGHDVIYIAEEKRSIDDDEVLQLANQSGSLLLTEDKDFGELVYRLGKANHGVILVRLAGLTPKSKAQRIVEALSDHPEAFEFAFTVISPGILRIRSPKKTE